MTSNKIIRTICYFINNPSGFDLNKVNNICHKLKAKQYKVQTKRICSKIKDIPELEKQIDDDSLYLSIGSLNLEEARNSLHEFYKSKNVSFNLDLTSEKIKEDYVQTLFEIINNKPEKTFNFTYAFNNPPSSPYFPSAKYSKKGFSIGLQPTDLSVNIKSLEDWLDLLRKTWEEINELFKNDEDYLGIDSSIAPLFEGDSSLVNFIKRLNLSFAQSVTTNIYLKITKYIKEQNPKPVGLCGLMFPCLEDFELAKEYEKGEFTIERNVYLSLHSGLGIDTYPIGIDENPQRVIEILKLIQALSSKYNKALSVRFVSDGKTKIGEKSNFQNQFLKDVIIRPL